MNRKIFQFIKPTLWKSYYFKTFIRYSAFMLIIVMSYSFILTNYMNRNMEKEISRSSKALLTQVQIFSDTYLIEKLNSIIIERFLDISKDKNLHDFFFSKNSLGPVFLVYQSISDILVNNRYIDSVYIYRKIDNTIISSKEGLIYPSNSSVISDEAAKTRKLIESTMASPENRKWISPGENKDSSFSKPIITFTQAIPILSTAEQRLGCFIININEEDFLKALGSVSDQTDRELMVMDSSGILFAHNNSEKLYNSTQYINSFKALLTGREGFTTINYNGSHLGINWIKSSINDWIFVSVVPIQVLNRPLIIIRQFSLFILCIIILIGFLGFNVITSWVYKPLNILIKTTKERFHIKDNSNELAIIDDVITSLSTQVDEMKITLAKNGNLIENKTVLEILNGNYTDDNEIFNRLKLIGKRFIFKRYSIVITEINKEIFLKLTTDNREYITYKMIELINTYINQECVCISICNPFNHIKTIVNHNNNLFYFDKLLQILRDEFSINCNIAISDPVTELKAISSINSSTCDYLKYRFIYNYGNIFTRRQIERFESNDAPHGFIISDLLETQLKSGKIIQAKDEIKKHIMEIRKNEYSYNYTQNLLLQITSLICRSVRELNITTDNPDIKRILLKINNIDLLDDYIDWLYKLFDIYVHFISERNSSIDLEFVSKIKEYISNNINNQISLNSVAEHFKMNASHLSTFFKEGTGINFSNFVMSKKLEKATNLLVGQNNLEVNEIAESIGYSNTTYFSKVFKEKYGMTPIQYRKMNV